MTLYGGKYQLQYPRSGASFEEIDAVGYVETSEIIEDSSPLVGDTSTTLSCAKVVGVQNFDVQYSCVCCKTPMPSSGTTEHGICKKCNTGQVLMDSKISAKLILQGVSWYSSDSKSLQCDTETNIW